jgi:hypothetical protein
MGTLELVGWLRAAKHNGQGRVIRWDVNPQAHDGRFEATKRIETRRCELARASMQIAFAKRREEKQDGMAA